MAKGIGLIGNFKGKVGNMVGYKLSDSNTGNSQGIRVYQPIVKNPKTSAQAEQRAKLAPINATYRALKMVIDRGNEGLPYGNKSRLAWLKGAFKAEGMPWIVKGQKITGPVLCSVSKGSLPNLTFAAREDDLAITCMGVTPESSVATIGAVSTLLKAAYPWLKDGDQITIVACGEVDGALNADVQSFIIDETSAVETTLFTAGSSLLTIEFGFSAPGYAVIVSREGANGEHLRSNTSLKMYSGYAAAAPYDDTSKEAAIESYMNSASANSDWAEESIQ